MKPWLCAAGVQLRDQIDTWYPDRRSTSDGWIGDARHSATKSDHRVFGFKWRRYRGINPHKKHIHISFTKAGDKDGKEFDIPLLGGKI